MENKKMQKGKTYYFDTVTGKKMHTFKVIKREVNKKEDDKKTRAVRVLASLDGGKEKYYYGKNDGVMDIIHIEKWDTNVVGSDKIID